MKKLLVILLLVVIGFAPCIKAADTDSVKAVTLRNDVRNLLGGPSISGYWSNTMIDRFINLACREYASISNIGCALEDTIITAADTTSTDFLLNSDFISCLGVMRLENGRKRALNNRDINSTSPAEMPLGQDNAASTGDHPRFYTIVHVNNRAYYLRLDPPEAISTVRDTILVDYKAYATALTDTGTITNIPYEGINFVIRMALLSCLMAGRDQPGVSLILPQAQKDYEEARSTVLNKYSPKYDQNWKPAQ